MSIAWPPDRRAKALLPRRDSLIRRLPRAIISAKDLTQDQVELVVDDTITYVAVEYPQPIRSAEEAERVFWRVANLRVARALEGRQSTVRGRFERAEESALSELEDPEDPVELVERRAERRMAAEFAASLDALEGQVLRVKFLSGTDDPVGYRKVAQELGIGSAQARAAERSITSKLDRFATIFTSGRLCEDRSDAIESYAAGMASADEISRARAHIKNCTACKADYLAQLRRVRSAPFQRGVAALVPAAPIAESARRAGVPVRDLLADWAARILGQEAGATASQAIASGVGRGTGAVVAAKLAAALSVGAAVVGVATGVMDEPVRKKPATAERATPTPTPRATPRPTATPTPPPVRAPNLSSAISRAGRAAREHTVVQKTQGGTSPTSHEESVVSPAAPGSLPSGASEFGPQPANSAPAPPAPVPAAPGAQEFP